MARKSTIKLLITNESANDSERLISLFRNAGRVARAQRAESVDELARLIGEQAGDLLIADEKHPSISIEQALEQLKKSDAFIPSIVISDADPIPLLEAGAHDVIRNDDDQRLILAAFRELQHLEHYRELQDVSEKLNDAEERSALLMEQSQDAIAYVSDGMLVNCNALFATRFGYEEPDDLDCAPVIDLIDSDDHDKFKGLLKSQLNAGEGSTNFNFTGLKPGGEGFSASMQLSNAVYDDEPCVQLSVRDPGSAGGGNGGNGGHSDQDYLTGLYSAPYLLSQVDTAAKQAAAGSGSSALCFITIDQYESLRRKYGLNAVNQLISSLADILKAGCGDKACLARYGDDSFVLLVDNYSSEKAMELATQLRQSLIEHTETMGEDDIQCGAHVGITMIEAQQTAPILLDQACSAMENAKSQGEGAAVYVPVKEKKSLGDASDDAELDKILEEALEDGQCFLIFQPVVSLRGASGDHYEVQTHMMDANDQEIDADEFLDSLHFSGVNTRLDRWIILEASKQLAAQVEAGHDTRLFINLTPNTLRDESLIAWLGVALKAGGIPSQAIAFQFQEADLLKYHKEAQVFAKAVKDLGCKISVANFGSHDDAAATLSKLQPDFTKIANNHTQALLTGSDSEKIKALIAAIGEQGTQSIITGVENAAALAQLWQLGVDFIQGAYLAGPSRQMDYEFTDIA